MWQEPFLVAQQTDSIEVAKSLSALANDQKLSCEAAKLSEDNFTDLAKLFQTVRALSILFSVRNTFCVSDPWTLREGFAKAPGATLEPAQIAELS